ncbi:MAG: SRPBCC family protein [Myxococcota bacterium]
MSKVLSALILGCIAIPGSSAAAPLRPAAPPARAWLEAPAPVQMSNIAVDTDLEPSRDGAIRARATVFVAASPDAVRDAVLDLQARADEGWMVDAVNVYRDETTEGSIHRRARWELSILGVDITYHCRYDWSRTSGKIRWSLDPSRSNDLELAQGVYELDPFEGGTLLTYTVEVGSKHAAARPLKRSITARNVRQLLDSIRERAKLRS